MIRLSNMSRTGKTLRENQKGMVAIMVTIILIIVISLITLGFSKVVRREQRQALDSQLSSQAFYAAESGVNLARKKINDALTNGSSAPAKPDCGPTSPFTPAEYTLTPDTADNVRITCIMINLAVSEIVKDNVGMNASVGLIDPGSNPINDIYVSWEENNNATVSNCAGPLADKLPSVTVGDWKCSQPILRLDLVPLGNGNNLNHSTLLNSQLTAFLYPQDAAGAITTLDFPTASGSNNMGKIFNVRCDNNISSNKPRKCSTQITGITHQKYGFRIMSIYKNANVTIHATNGGPKVSLIGEQALIDSTAVAGDISHRVQARVKLNGANGIIPDFALSAGGNICKQYEIDGGSVTIPAVADAAGCKPTGW